METSEKRKRAKKRVEEIKGFYIHLMVYIVVNLLILSANLFVSSEHGEIPFGWPNLITPFFWGIGLAFHALNVFGYRSFLGKKWEDRMIRKFMEEDRREADKYKEQP